MKGKDGKRKPPNIDIWICVMYACICTSDTSNDHDEQAQHFEVVMCFLVVIQKWASKCNISSNSMVALLHIFHFMFCLLKIIFPPMANIS